MKRATSAHTRSLLTSLYQPVSFWKSSSKHRIQVLASLSEAREAAAIPDIVPLLLDNNSGVACAAADAVSVLIKTLKPTDYPWLDELMRAGSSYRWPQTNVWSALKADGVHRLLSLGESSTIALGIATFHRSGYVRQEALRRLASANNGVELPFLLLRLNDWVNAVRHTADLLVRERLISKYADAFVDNLALLRRLALTQRGRYSEIMQGIAWLLRSEQGRKATQRGLSSDDLELRRACYEFAFQFESVDPMLLIEKGLSDRDPAVRAFVIGKCESIRDAGTTEHFLKRARTDAYAPVRRKALQIFVDKFPAAAEAWLQASLLDSHPSLRGYAQFKMARVHGVQVAEFYRKAISSHDPTTNLYAAILGLGETGVAGDAPLILPYVSGSVPRIRRAVLRAIARLETEANVDVFQKYISDNSPAVSREAMRGLAKLIYLLAGEHLWQIYLESSSAHV